MKLAAECIFTYPVMGNDSYNVIEAINCKEKSFSLFHLIIRDIFAFISTFNSIFWSFVGREGNKMANTFAHFASGKWVLG